MQKLNNVLIGRYRHKRVGRENQPSALYWNDSYRSDDVNTTTAYTQNYSYDLMGNINELQHTGDSNFTRTYTHSNNLLNNFEAGGNTFYYEYDSCGNQIKENEERHMQWDYADKLRLYYNQASTGTEPSVYTHYLYDAGGNRVKKLNRTEGGNWETITYIDGIIEYREDQDSNLQSISHVMDDTKRIATIREGSDFGDSTPAIKYNLDDHLGSSNILVDENGTLVNIEEYYPFGETGFGSYAKKRYRFCGKEKDEESGMYYYGARYYAPWLCRFVSVDPLAGKYPFYTPFQYAGNQPINFIDLDGLEQAPANENSSNVTPTPPAPVQGNNTGGEQQEATGSLKGCCVTEPTVNGNQGPYSAQYVKQQQQANNQKQAAEAEKTKQEQKKTEFIKNMNNPEFMTKFYLERALEGSASAGGSASGEANAPTAAEGQKAAQELLKSKNVTFITKHPNKHTPDDNANASDNIKDAAAGKPVNRSNYEKAKGGTVELNPKLLVGLLELSRKYNFSVQELAGGSHSTGSEHYNGNAVDINWLNGVHVGESHPDAKQFMEDAKKLGFIINNEWKLKSGAHFHMTIK